MHLLNFIYLFLFPFLSVAPEPSLFPSGVDSSDFTASPGLSNEGNGFEPIKLEILSPVAGNTAPPGLVKGEGDPSGVQSDPEILLLAGKPKKDIPTPTQTPNPTIFGPPIRQNPNVPEEAWDAYAGYPQPSDLPDLYIPGTQTYKPQIRGLCLKGKELFCCRWVAIPIYLRERLHVAQLNALNVGFSAALSKPPSFPLPIAPDSPW